MKILAILFILFTVMEGCVPGNTPEKFFTGEVVYSYSFESDVLDTDSLAKERPATGIFRYDLDNYQSRFFGKDTTTCFYSGRQKKCLLQTGSSGNYDCVDYGINNDSVISWKLYAAGEKILGQDCDVLELQKRTSLVKYYVSKVKRIAPGTYKGHNAYNWDVYGEKANGGLILKVEHRFSFFTLKGIATEIKDHGEKFQALEIDEKKLDSLCDKLIKNQTH